MKTEEAKQRIVVRRSNSPTGGKRELVAWLRQSMRVNPRGELVIEHGTATVREIKKEAA